MTLQEFTNRYHYNPSEDKLGAGGFGQVYKAYDTVLDREVAIKIASVIEGKENLSLMKEVELANQLPAHVNIVNYESCFRISGIDGSKDIGILQYYPEGSLATIIKKNKLSAGQINDLARGILNGLDFLHEHNVMHRDMKPGNVLISKRGDQYIPKIADFGLSKQVESFEQSSFVNSFVGGSAYYAAPEQLAGEKVRQNVDLWSFGVMLYELVTGDRPFTATSTKSDTENARLEIYGKIQSGQLPDKIKTIVQPYQTIIRACLVPDRTKRVQTVADVADILDNNYGEFVTYDNTGTYDAEETMVERNEKTSTHSHSSSKLSNNKKALFTGAQARKKRKVNKETSIPVEPLESYIPRERNKKTKEKDKKRKIWPLILKAWLGFSVLSTVIYILLYGGVSDEVVNENVITENVVKIEMDMVAVAGGVFDMGCHSSRKECLDNELPVHSVILDSFRISKYEVTMSQWNAIMGDHPADSWNYPNCPVLQVSWDDVQLFISKLNEFTSKDYRLPTEAEWEYAAGGGRLSKNYLFSGSNDVGKVAWANAANIKFKPQFVGGLDANELGLYDMTGNVFEWCSDWYDAGYYESSIALNPNGPSSGTGRVIRGGGLGVDIQIDALYTSYRTMSNPEESYKNVGFRLASD